MAVMLDELYRDTLQATVKIQSFIEKISYKLEGQELLLNSFDYYVLDPEFNKEQEKFMIPLKKSTLCESVSFIDDPWEFLKQDYQNFKIGSREYNIDSESWNNMAKFNAPPSKKDLKECNSASPSLRSSLVKSIVSPRMTVKRFDFHKAHTATPLMFSSLQLGQEDSSPEINSARLGGVYSAGFHKKEHSIASISETENRHQSLSMSQSQYFGHSANSWNPSSSNSTNTHRLLTNPSPKKSSLKSFFGVKSKSSKQILPVRPLGPLIETRNKE